MCKPARDFETVPSKRFRCLPGNLMSEAATRNPVAAAAVANIEYPMTVRQAAKSLGVSPQTVYLGVERKQIPHLGVIGRNIRFLKSDLEPFRASFRQEMENF